MSFDTDPLCIYKDLVAIAFDPVKDAINRHKHGISLARAEEFDFDSAFITLDDRADYGEQRYLAIGFLGERLFPLVFVAEENPGIRAISLRKANTREMNEYAAQ